MKFSKKSSNKSEETPVIDLSRDIEALARHKKKGIPLTPNQEQILRDAGRWEEPTDSQLIKKVQAACRKFCNESREGQEAIDKGYYTEFLEYIYKIALNQAFSDRSFWFTIPDPVPDLWLKRGQQRLESLVNGGNLKLSPYQK